MRGETDARERVLLAALLLFVAGLCLQPITESDLFFRLRAGQEILSTRALPVRNLFSFTAPDHPDLDPSWAFEVAVAMLHRWGGFQLVVAAKAIWMIATVAAAFALCRRRGAGVLASTLTLAAAAWVMRERLVERPHVVSFAGEVVVLWALDTCDHQRRWRRTWMLVFAVAMVAWANMHAGIFVGVLLSLLTALGAWPTDRRRAGRAMLVGVAVSVAAAINPVGPTGIVRYLALHVRLPRLHTVDEFRAATWRSDAPFFTWVVALAAVVVVLFWLLRRRSSTRDLGGNRAGSELPRLDVLHPSYLLPVVGMVILAWWSVRFSADAVLVAAPLMAVGMSSLFEWIAHTSPNRPWRQISRLGKPLTVMVLVVATSAPAVTAARAGRPVCDVQVDTASLPLDALRFVEDNGLRERMYNDFETGSFLLFQGYPRYRVFVDPRLPAYPEEMHRLLGSFDLDRASWGAAMTKYGVETALLGYAGINRRVAWWDPAEWALVYRAHDARVFVRRRREWRELIAAREIPATFDFSVEQGTTTHLLENKPSQSPVTGCEWQRRLGELAFELDGGTAARAHPYFERALALPGCLDRNDEAALSAWVGALEMPAPDAEHALAHLNRALELLPGDAQTRANRATILERLGRPADAAAEWIRVAAGSSDAAIGRAASARARTLSARAVTTGR